MTLSELDIALLRFIHHNRPILLDSVLYYISYSTTFVSVFFLLALLVQSLRKKSPELRRKFYQLLSVFLLCAITSFCLKHTIIRERPFITYPDIQKLSQAGSSSFPSGHTMEVFALALAVAILFPQRKYIILAFTWALLIAYTRMALGVHYPSDVVGGACIALCLSYATLKTFDRLWQKKTTP